MGIKQLQGIANDLKSSFTEHPLNGGATYEVEHILRKNTFDKIEIDLLNSKITPEIDWKTLSNKVESFQNWFLTALKKINVDISKIDSAKIILIKKTNVRRIKNEDEIIEQKIPFIATSVEVKTKEGKIFSSN